MMTTPDNRIDSGVERSVWRYVWCLAALVLVVVAIVQWRVDRQFRVVHAPALTMDRDSHLIGRLTAFLDEGTVALLTPRQLSTMQDTLGREWSSAGESASAEFETELQALLDERLTASFDEVRGRVADVADWHYELSTSYRLLLELGREVAGTGDLEQYVADEVRRMLITDSGLATRLDADLMALGQLYRSRIGQLEAGMDEVMARKIRTMAAESGRLYGNESVPENPATLAARPMDWSSLRVPVGDGLLSDTGINTLSAGIVTMSASRLASNAAVRRAGAGVTRRAASVVAGRSASAAGSVSAAGAGALVCGPLAVVCGPVAGAAVFGLTWLGMDYALTRTDEALHREAFEAALLEQVDALQARAAADLQGSLQPAFDIAAARLAEDRLDAIRAQTQRLSRPLPAVVPAERLRGR